MLYGINKIVIEHQQPNVIVHRLSTNESEILFIGFSVYFQKHCTRLISSKNFNTGKITIMVNYQQDISLGIVNLSVWGE